VTYRVAGTIPLHVIQEIQERRDLELRKRRLSGTAGVEVRSRIHKQAFADYDAYLDRNQGVDWLARPEVAAMLQDNLYHHRGNKYHLLAYCIMPNHVHVLLLPIEIRSDKLPTCRPEQADGHAGSLPDGREPPLEVADAGSPLSGIMHSLKSYTANQANQLLGRTGQFWQHESYDHWVRDDDELERIVSYIASNPIKAGLAQRPEQWSWCSARDQHRLNGDNSGWLWQETS
jgi:putative DNA methylase